MQLVLFFKIRKFYLIITVVSGILIHCGCWTKVHGDENADDTYPATNSNQTERISSDSCYDLVQQIWIQKSNDYEVSNKTSNLVCELFRQIVEPPDCKGNFEADELEKSIDRYLRQFKHTFNHERVGRKRVKRACYWMAWLLAQCATRPEISPEDVKKTRIWWRSFIDKIMQKLNEKARAALGSEKYEEYEPQVKQALDWTKKMLQFYFDELHEDPLFPIFKKPLSAYAEDKVFWHLKNESILANRLKKPIKPMVLEEEFYTNIIENYFKVMPKTIACQAVAYETMKEFKKPIYWGGMGPMASSTGEGVWPIEMYLEPIKTKENQYGK